MAQTREFGEIRDSLERDRFICGLSSAAVKEKFLGITNITLDKAIDICKAAGLVKEQLRVFDIPTYEQVADVKTSGRTSRKPTAYGLTSAGEQVLEKPSSWTTRGNASIGRRKMYTLRL